MGGWLAEIDGKGRAVSAWFFSFFFNVHVMGLVVSGIWAPAAAPELLVFWLRLAGN